MFPGRWPELFSFPGVREGGARREPPGPLRTGLCRGHLNSRGFPLVTAASLIEVTPPLGTAPQGQCRSQPVAWPKPLTYFCTFFTPDPPIVHLYRKLWRSLFVLVCPCPFVKSLARQRTWPPGTATQVSFSSGFHQGLR